MRYRTALTLILGLIFGISGAAYISHKEKHRAPSSVEGKLPWVPTIEKHLAPLKVEINSPSEIPDDGSSEVVLIGRILINQNIQNDLTYTWTIPDGVQVVDGELSDNLAGVKMGQIVELKLTVTGFTKEKQSAISLQATANQGAELIGNSAVVVSRPEDTWEAVAPEMKKAADEQLGTDSKSNRSRQ